LDKGHWISEWQVCGGMILHLPSSKDSGGDGAVTFLVRLCS